jgi:hypothetical protein
VRKAALRHALFVAIGVGVVLAGAPAYGQDDPACAQYDEPLAYNACLAKSGPHAPATKGVAAPPDDAGAPRAYPSRRNYGRWTPPGRRGRMRVEFDVGGKRWRH